MYVCVCVCAHARTYLCVCARAYLCVCVRARGACASSVVISLLAFLIVIKIMLNQQVNPSDVCLVALLPLCSAKYATCRSVCVCTVSNKCSLHISGVDLRELLPFVTKNLRTFLLFCISAHAYSQRPARPDESEATRGDANAIRSGAATVSGGPVQRANRGSGFPFPEINHFLVTQDGATGGKGDNLLRG